MKKLLTKTKKILVSLLFLWAMFSFLWTSFSYAQSTDQDSISDSNTTDNSDINSIIQSKLDLMNWFLRILYILLRPLLIIAGISLDNTMVYWSFIHLDTYLRQIWNITKNFANFTLWFLVLFEILKWYFKKDWSKQIIWVIWKALIAWVLIQASWFLLWTTIDIANIMTYSVWSLPTSMWVGKNDNIQNSKIIASNVLVDLQNWNMSTDYTFGNKKLSKCVKYKWYLIWREKTSDNYSYSSNKWSTNLFWNNVRWDLCMDIMWPATVYIWTGLNTTVRNTDNYDCIIGSLKKIIDDPDNFTLDADCSYVWDEEWSLILKSQINNWAILYVWQNGFSKPSWLVDTKNTVNIKISKNNWDKRLQDVSNWWNWWNSLSSILSNTKSYSKSLVTMVNSLMNFADVWVVFNNQQVDSDTWTWLLFFIKILVMLALLIPVFILAIVLLVRIARLWLVIAFIPFFIVKWVFFKDKKVDWLDDIIWSPGEVASVIFAPVIIIFTIWISLVFLTALNKTFVWSWASSYSILNELWKNSVSDWSLNVLWWLLKVQFANASNGLSYLLIQIFGIVIMWFLVFVAIKSNKIWKSIVEKTWAEKRLWWLAKSIPIMSVKWADWKQVWVWAWAVFNNIIWWWSSWIVNKALSQVIQLQNTNFMNALQKKDDDNTN